MEYLDISNEPVEIDVGGRKLRLAPLTINDLFGHFQAKMQSKRIAEAQEFAKGLPSEDRRTFLMDAFKDKPNPVETMQSIAGQLGSLEGLQDLLYLSVRKNHPEIKEVSDLNGVITEANMDVLNAHFGEICSFAADEDGKIPETEEEDEEGEKKNQQELTGEKPSGPSLTNTADQSMSES